MRTCNTMEALKAIAASPDSAVRVGQFVRTKRACSVRAYGWVTGVSEHYATVRYTPHHARQLPLAWLEAAR